MTENRTEKELVETYFTEKQLILADMRQPNFLEKIVCLVDIVWESYIKDGTLYACANGGGAGLIDNLTTDLALHPFVSDDKSIEMKGVRRLRTKNLGASQGILTGLANDLGYENVFVGQLRGEMKRDDLIIGFSGSGNSRNVLSAFEYANSVGARSICISGRGGGKASEIAHLNIVIPGVSVFPGQVGGNQNNFHIEDMQVEITHIVTGLFKKRVQDSYDNHTKRDSI
jgi:D-sedoheptulose 7-phosphate isomerase